MISTNQTQARGVGGQDGRLWSRHSLWERRRRRTGLILVLPAFIIVCLFFLLPLVFAFYISLTDWPLVGSYHFIGLSNYAMLAQDSTYLHTLLFTIEYTAVVTLPIFVVGYGLALLVRRRFRGVGFFRTVYFLPFVVGLSTLSYMAVLELQPQYGIVDFILGSLHIASSETAWLVKPGLALIGIGVLVVWASSGLTMVILMGGMQGIPQEFYESAQVDGATRAQQEWHVTLPLLRRSIALSLILSVIGSLLAFNQFFILTQGGPGTSTATVVLWIYEVAFVQFHLGYATAMSIVLLLVAVILSTVQLVLLRDTDR